MINLGGIQLPDTAVTQTHGLLAVRGAGKTNAARVMAEEMFAAGLPFCAIDPVGSWRGLRSGADGSSAGGLPIPIFGGDFGDIPLERGGGEVIADAIVDQRLSCVVDLSAFTSEGDKKTFLLAFARRLYQRNRDPLHLFLEEADDYVPQKPMRDETQLLRAWENIVRRGRSRGLGITLITQRSAVVNKNVLTQVETLFALRTTGPQDIKAIETWMQYHGANRELLGSLAGLEDGEAWVWSPHQLKVTKRFKFRRSTTFDSGATPKNVKGKAARKAATLADVDLAGLREQMAATIERAQAEDPKALRKRVAELEKQLKAMPDTEPRVERVEVPVFTAKEAGLIEHLSERFDALSKDLGQLRELLPKAQTKATAAKTTTAPVRVVASARPAVSKPSPRDAHFVTTGESRIGKGELTVLALVAQFGRINRSAITAFTSYKRSTRDAYVQRLRDAGLVTVEGLEIATTAATARALPKDWQPLPVGAELREHWLASLPEGEAKMLQHAIDVYPEWVPRESVTAEYARSTRDAYIQRAEKKMLLKTSKQGFKAADELFLEG